MNDTVTNIATEATPDIAVPVLVPETAEPDATVATPMPTETVAWADVAAASAEAQQPDEEVDYVEDKLSVELTDAEILARSRANGERLAERTQLEADLETKRAEAKAIKSEIDELQAEIDQCTKEMASRRALVTKRWRVVSSFRRHEENYYDPDDGRHVHGPLPIPTNRKQLSLPLANAASNPPPSADDVDFDDDDEALSDDDEPRDLEDRLDAVLTAPDSTTNLTGDPDDTEPPSDNATEIDPTEILEAASSASGEPVGSPPPEKPSRRGRKAQ